MNHPTLTYNIDLPQSVEQILESEFWVYNHISAEQLRSINEAVKFTSCVSVFVEKGTAELEINLLNVQVEAPCVVLIKAAEVVQLKYLSDDFDASFVVLSGKMLEFLMLALHDAGASPVAHLSPVTLIPNADIDAFAEFYHDALELSTEKENPHRNQAFFYRVLAFYFRTGYRCFRPADKSSEELLRASSHRNPLVDKFLLLVQQNFKKQRQIDYYATRLGVTSKHLSRILKQTTGYTAADWIKNYLMLEAKVMLKSSTMTMGQIALQLNFPSQSFFAKFFKHTTGMTPKQYRNS